MIMTPVRENELEQCLAGDLVKVTLDSTRHMVYAGKQKPSIYWYDEFLEQNPNSKEIFSYTSYRQFLHFDEAKGVILDPHHSSVDKWLPWHSEYQEKVELLKKAKMWSEN